MSSAYREGEPLVHALLLTPGQVQVERVMLGRDDVCGSIRESLSLSLLFSHSQDQIIGQLHSLFSPRSSCFIIKSNRQPDSAIKGHLRVIISLNIRLSSQLYAITLLSQFLALLLPCAPFLLIAMGDHILYSFKVHRTKRMPES